MGNSDSSQPGWVTTAQKLRKVRGACLMFLDRWAVSQLLIDAPALDRVAYDVESQVEAAIADPKNKNWSVLYRGSVLDD
jgi:hypothetical protein